jgi:hypothetical protein
LSKHKNIGSLIKELQYNRTKNGTPYPGEDSSEEDVAGYRQANGVPEKPEGYGINAENAKLPEGVPFDEEMAGVISQAAHELHAPPAVVAGLMEKYNEIMSTRVAEHAKTQAEAQAASRDTLAKEWGGDYEGNSSTVRHLTTVLAEAAGIPHDSQDIPMLANNPAFAKIMMQVNANVSEDSMTMPQGFGNIQSPQEKINAIKAGDDPVWSPLLKSRNEADRLKVYEHMNGLKSQIRS